MQIANIFTDVYGYLCNIEDISNGDKQEDGNPTTNVLSHFIDEANEEPVLSSEIEAWVSFSFFFLYFKIITYLTLKKKKTD